ncbi:MAG: DNA polymerase III subunit epsilon [Alphaproteobacteria bacterium]|nr:DNA polymerase III subunit epsilon [Alphaproteobacteria bacterium]
MREIVLDTETTGLDPASGDRILEIGCLELNHHVPTGRRLHHLINPERQVSQGALDVHGLSNELLAGKPVFAEIVDELLAFIGEDRLVIHNAEFDMKFLNAEFARLGRPPLPMSRAIDTLRLARQTFPGAPASLDALCKRFGVDNSARELHGALLDAELLAEVYLELKGGRQPVLIAGEDGTGEDMRILAEVPARRRPAPLLREPTAEEAAIHAAFIAQELGEKAFWRRYLMAGPEAG